MKRKCNIKVHFEIIAFLGDQPERRSMNYLMLGNSRFGARYSYSVDLESIAKHLPMCKSCLNNSKRDRYYIMKETKCNNCLQ